jgi:hypothetical protein
VTAVSNTATATALMSSSNPSVVGGPVTFTATVTPKPSGGTVQFKVDGTATGSPAVLGSTGAASSGAISSLTAGSHTITAVYSGTTGFSGSTGTLTQVVTVAPPSKIATVLTVDPNVSLSLAPSGVSLGVYVLSARGTLKTAGGAPVVGRTVTMKALGGTICSGVTDSAGVVKCGGLVSNLTVVLGLGYTGTFAGDTTYLPSTGSTPLINVLGIRLL